MMTIQGPKRQREVPPVIQGLLTQTQNVSQLAQNLIDIAENNLPQLRNQLLKGFLADNQLKVEQSLDQLVDFIKSYISKRKKATYAYQEKVFTSSFATVSKENLLAKPQAQSLEQYAKDRNIGLLNDYKFCNIWYSLLNCFSAKMHTSSIKKSILFELFSELPQATVSLIELYHQAELTELNYYSHLQIIFEKLDWFIAHTEEYETLLILDIETCLDKPDPYVLHTLSVRISHLVELYISSSRLYTSLLKEDKSLEVDNKLKRLIESVKTKLVNKIREQIKTSILKEEFQDIYEELQNIVTLERAIHETKEQAKSLGERNWLQLYSTLEQFYEQDWQKLHPTAFINIESIHRKVNDLQTHLATSKKDILNNKDIISLTNNILAILKTYRAIDRTSLSKDVIQLYITITLSFLRLLKQEFKLNSGFITSTILALLNLIATELLEDSKNTTSLVNQVQTQLSQLTLDEKQDEKQLSKQLTDLEVTHKQRLTEEERKLAENEHKHYKNRQDKFAKQKADLEQNFQNQLTTLQKQSSARKEALILEQNHQLGVIKQQHEDKMTELKTENQTSLQKIKQTFSENLKQLKTKQQSEIEELKAEYANQVALLKAEHESIYDSQKIKHAENIAKLDEEHQSKILLLQSANTSELLRLEQSELQFLHDSNLKHKKNLNKLSENHRLKIKQLKQQYDEKLSQLIQNQQEQIQTIRKENKLELTQRRQEMEAELDDIKRKLPMQSIQGLQPIGQMEVSSEVQYILQDMLDAGIEVFIVGGRPRNALLGKKLSTSDDVDVIVNCSYDKLPAKFRLRAKQNPQESRQVKIGNIDFWCESWTDLPAALRRRDFTINAFIAKINGDIYDLLGYQSHIQSPFLHIIGDLKTRFENDPSLMLRMLRFSTQLNKKIHPDDLKIMHACRHKIKTLPIGIYLKNLEHLFLCPLALKHFESVNNYAMLFDILPFPIDGFNILLAQRPLIYDFWQRKLKFYSQTEGVTYYHILGLFLLPSILQHNMNGKSVDLAVDDCLNDFFVQYKGEANANERLKLERSVSSVIKDQANQGVFGLFSQFTMFEASASAYTPYKDAQSVPRVEKLSSSSAQRTKQAKTLL